MAGSFSVAAEHGCVIGVDALDVLYNRDDLDRLVIAQGYESVVMSFAQARALVFGLAEVLEIESLSEAA